MFYPKWLAKKKKAIPSSSQFLMFSWHLYLVTSVLCVCWFCCYYQPSVDLMKIQRFSMLYWSGSCTSKPKKPSATAVGTFRILSTGTRFSLLQNSYVILIFQTKISRRCQKSCYRLTVLYPDPKFTGWNLILNGTWSGSGEVIRSRRQSFYEWD